MQWGAGSLLVAAAVLKAAEVIVDPASAMLAPLGQYLLPARIGLEFAIGLLLLSGYYWRALRWLAMVLFTGFAGYSLYLGIGGAASCGCFGPVKVSPWWTFGLDAFIIVGFLASIVCEWRKNGDELVSPDSVAVRQSAGRHAGLAVISGIAVVCTALLFRYVTQRCAAASELLSVSNSTGEFVILEPEKWIGRKLPIADSIDVDLSHGTWVMLLHRHDCPVCQEQVPQYENRADRGEHVALVEVPPYGEFERHNASCLYGKLKESRDWFVQTPAEIQLKDGLVTAVQQHEH